MNFDSQIEKYAKYIPLVKKTKKLAKKQKNKEKIVASDYLKLAQTYGRTLGVDIDFSSEEAFRKSISDVAKKYNLEPSAVDGIWDSVSSELEEPGDRNLNHMIRRTPDILASMNIPGISSKAAIASLLLDDDD